MSMLRQVHIRMLETSERMVRHFPRWRRKLGLPRIVERSTTRWYHANREELAASGVVMVPLPDSDVRRTPFPACLNGAPPASWTWAKEWTPRERFYIEIPHGRLAFEPWRCATAVLPPGESILHDAVDLFFHKPAVHPVRDSVLPQEPLRLKGRAFLLFNDAASNFYHWHCDVLPRLLVAQRAGKSVADFDWFVTDRLYQPFHRETLGAFGIPPEKVIVGTKHRLIEADVLCATSLYDRSGMVHREGLSFVRDTLLRHFSITDEAPGTRRLFISRQQANWRRIENWNDIEPILADYGFEIVVSEQLSMSEQIRLFRAAGHIIAGHGAGLTNLMYCQPGTRVLEMLNEAWGHPMYWLMASKSGLDYSMMHAAFVGRTGPETDDMRVDPKPLAAYLKSIYG